MGVLQQLESDASGQVAHPDSRGSQRTRPRPDRWWLAGPHLAPMRDPQGCTHADLREQDGVTAEVPWPLQDPRHVWCAGCASTVRLVPTGRRDYRRVDNNLAIRNDFLIELADVPSPQDPRPTADPKLSGHPALSEVG